MKTCVAIAILIFLLSPLYHCHGQISSIAGKIEANAIVEKTIAAGLVQHEKIKTEVDSLYYEANKRVYESIQKKDIGVIKMFSYKQVRKIDSYDFADSVNLYFSIDTSHYIVYFFDCFKNKNVVFATTRKYENTDRFNSVKKLSDVNEITFYANYPERHKAYLMFGIMEYFIVKDNCMFIIADGRLHKASEYFKLHAEEYPLKTLAYDFVDIYSKPSK